MDCPVHAITEPGERIPEAAHPFSSSPEDSAENLQHRVE